MANLNGNNGNNILTGGRADDVINGYGGHDILTGGGGLDIIVGGPGTDFIIGNQGPDTLDGGPDADIIWGGNGNDLIFGGPGDDTIYGGTGEDILIGGPGRDTFVFNSNQPGRDVIVDFEPGDRIDVRGVDGLLDPDQVANREDNDFLYLLSGDGGAFIEGVREYLSLFDLPLPGPARFDHA